MPSTDASTRHPVRIARRLVAIFALALAAAAILAIAIYIAWVFGIVLVEAFQSLPLGRPLG